MVKVPSTAVTQRILRGESLWRALGFNSERAFQRARQMGKLGLRLYPNPENRGVYAYLADVEAYRAKLAGGSDALPRALNQSEEEDRP